MKAHLRQAARELISSQFGGLDCSDVADPALIQLIEGMYLGGWLKFQRDHLAPVVTELTAAQQLRRVLDLTGHRVRLEIFEEVEKVTISDTAIMVLISTADVTETGSEYRIKRVGHRLVSLRFEPSCGCPDQPECECNYSDGYWWVDQMEVWDKSDITYKRGDHVGYAEQAKRIEWERICYRPGNARNPMDNSNINS